MCGNGKRLGFGDKWGMETWGRGCRLTTLLSNPIPKVEFSLERSFLWVSAYDNVCILCAPYYVFVVWLCLHPRFFFYFY